MLLQLPALDQLFISVKRIEVTHPQCLTFFLHRPDYWLAHRLASYCSHLAHPQFPLIGTGPFRLTQFTAELVRLESHDYYHLRHPLLKAVEYWITPPLFEKIWEPVVGIPCKSLSANLRSCNGSARSVVASV